MVGLGETDDEVLAAIDDLVANGVRIIDDRPIPAAHAETPAGRRLRNS